MAAAETYMFNGTDLDWRSERLAFFTVGQPKRAAEFVNMANDLGC